MGLRGALTAVLCSISTLSGACSTEGGDSDYIEISQVQQQARTSPEPSTWVSECGRNETGHRNADNVVAQPQIPAGAHHTHEYVGNLSTDAFSTDQSLAAAATTCQLDDRSTYYWPVLRLTEQQGDDAHATGGGMDGNHGKILPPASVRIEYRGNPASNVVAMPRFLRTITGNPVAVSQNGQHAERVQWSCSGDRSRVTNRYPRCATGQQVVRIFDFPSCWDGKNTDSQLHRSHLTFPTGGGVCAIGTFPVPQLHIEVAYDVPAGARYAIDSFPEERRSPTTDHAMYIDVMPDSLMAQVAGCLNRLSPC
ncbi:hypothetical protein JOF56_005582 [Kibdelosporangium banguiense]|uniref:DUF1996 domain-containing protein n=1 Tax=Kibdelosporangium banguiense TaxID=1365924 RepID=A0ABS4TLB3_9PSEU|nr:DUF1996 domain-containing protein [Kibdelosporangium banguiense]MBP2325197.1 hypothetical protein [Kibdelosporangium banguiense]